MRKLLLIILIFLIFAVSFELPSSITGFFVKVTSAALTVAKEILKSVLTAIVNML
jgi:hypothetical protein